MPINLRTKFYALIVLAAMLSTVAFLASGHHDVAGLQALLLAAIVLVLLTLTIGFERSLRRRLTQLTAAASALTQGRSDLALPPATSDEIGALAGEFAAAHRSIKQHRDAFAKIAVELAAQKRALDAHNVVLICDASGLIVSANERYSALTGFTLHDVAATPFADRTCGEQHDDTIAGAYATLNTGMHWQGELVLQQKHGDGLTVDATCVPYMDQHGTLARFIVIATDITARRAAEQQLIAAETRLRHLITSSPSVIYTTVPSGDGRITYVSDNLKRLLGYEPSEVFANPDFWHDHIHADDREKVFTGLPNLFVDGQHAFEYRFRHGDGQYRWIFDQLRLIRGDDNAPVEVVGSLTDITQQKHAEQAAQEREDRLRTLFDNALDAIFTIDRRGCIESVNAAALRMFGYEAAELVGAQVNVLMPAATSAIHDEHLERYLTVGPRFSHERTREVTAQRKDGSAFPVEIAISPMALKDGVRFLGVIRDITDRKHSEQVIVAYRDHLEQLVQDRTKELEHARDDALMAEKTMSTFLANMSHELRTPLHAILSFATFGAKKFDKVGPDKLKEYYALIHSSGHRLLSLVNNLLDLAKLRSGKMMFDYQPTDLLAVVRDVVQELHAYCEDRGVTVRVAEPVVDVRLVADRAKLGQVVRNLLSNAIKFSPKGACVDVEFQVRKVDVTMTVCDRGVGIPEAELALIFDPFTQSSETATNAGGTGLGLPICREIVEQGHGGKIWAQNRDGGGACLTVCLPRTPALPTK